MLRHISRPGKALYVPMGWYGVESTRPKHSLCYGIRKAWATALPGDLARYESTANIMQRSNRNGDSMNAISCKPARLRRHLHSMPAWRVRPLHVFCMSRTTMLRGRTVKSN